MLIVIIIGALLLFAYIVHVFTTGFFVPLLIVIGVLVLAIIMPFAGAKIREVLARKPKLTAKQTQALAEARKQDDQIKEKNAAALAAAQEQHDKDLAVRSVELEKEIHALSTTLASDLTRLKAEFAALEAMDCLGEDEKDLQTIDLLIHFIKTRRADNIKEALHEYDKLMANQQMLQLENEKLELERQKAIQEHQDRVKQMKMQEQHNREMEFRARSAADESRRIANQLDYIGYLAHVDVNYNR
jgi:hypothetical protein